jgi:hypothetical protein
MNATASLDRRLPRLVVVAALSLARSRLFTFEPSAVDPHAPG